MTMTDTKHLLERASRSAPPVPFDLDDVRRRGERRDRTQRVRAGVVGVTLAVIATIVAFAALQGTAPRSVESPYASSGATLPPATRLPLVAAPGQQYYRAVLLARAPCAGQVVAECAEAGTRLDATYWWSPDDDSGRIAVDEAKAYGIEGGRFAPGAFPNYNGIDVSGFPLETDALTRFLLTRSAEDGASPAPLVTPPPEGAPNDGQLWRAITDLLVDPHVTPTVRSALLDVAAGLQGTTLELDVADPSGRPADAIVFGNWGGELEERLYVDPDSHELLAWTTSSEGVILEIYLVQHAGLADSTETAPQPDGGSVPLTLLSTEDLVRLLGSSG
jgi:hypothetical protein